MTVDDLPVVRELDHRASEGVDVRLLWHEYDSRVSGAVLDATTGDHFTVLVPACDRVLDVFDRPFPLRRLARGRHVRRRRGAGPRVAAQPIA